MTAPAMLSRARAVIEALRGNSFAGLRLQEVADAVHQSPSTTLRDLRALTAVGWVEHAEDKGCWRLSPRLVQIALAYQHELSRHETRLDDFRTRYSRVPH